MHGETTRLLTVADVWIFLGVWAAAALAYAIWRSRGDARTDPLRPSGPVF